MSRLLPVIFLLTVFTHRASAQTNSQIWYEYMLTAPFSNTWEIENAFTYSTLLGKDRWRALDYAPTIQWSWTPHVDLMSALTFSRSWQTSSVNTLELRPMLGLRFHFTPNKRVLTRALLRFEQRNFKDIETRDWTSSNRSRVRLESQIPLNNPTMFNKDKMWYVITDVEWFFVVDEDLMERFANRFRWRTAIGYRLNYNFRFELMFTYQESRNELESSASTQDNIYRIRFRHFLNRDKPSKRLGVGN